ncbi:hypothetical protein Poli38472_002159 [Pythium oligandrum]|uniref:Kinesin-like protein n=1 Tax=Pythium oligandrum TaxID=41045 RepID=A0A8K1CIS1_PYTOL|nr:hypothetical protein Poli38472_002159 [Pythium oligandrum]|eukprot:TMW63218.1 hypothetical protein Poli38472_002159 [Pythium oligandrum]
MVGHLSYGYEEEDVAIEEAMSGMLVAVRLRPITDNEKREGHRTCCRVVGDQVVVIEKFGVPNGHLKSQQSSKKEYAYDFAFSEDSTQDEVYAKTVKDIVPTILDGYNATIFAYGATGAGKTHTMMGSERDGLGEFDDFDDDDYQVDGIIPHALTDIFRIIRCRQEEEEYLNIAQGSTFEWKVLVSYLEVYNEQIRDLLQPSTRALSLREDPARGIVQVAGLHHEEVNSVGQVMQLLRFGNRNRKTEPTAANKVSSRSHAVIQVSIRHTTTTMLSDRNPRKAVVEGKLSLIDLAGSERASSTQNRGMRLTEGANINKSLLALANCINSLSAQNRRLGGSSYDSPEGAKRGNSGKAKVQYRDSKLTHLLKNSLEGECRLVMIANVNPSHACFDESHNTLKYANRAKNIKIRPKMNVVTAEMSYQQRIEKLEKENVHLRHALANAHAELEQQGITKRKSIHLHDDVSLSTMKRFKNFPLGESAISANRSSEELENVAALRATIKHLHEEKSKLEEQVVDLKTENQNLQARILKADTFLKTIEDNSICDSIALVEPVAPPTFHSAVVEPPIQPSSFRSAVVDPPVRPSSFRSAVLEPPTVPYRNVVYQPAPIEAKHFSPPKRIRNGHQRASMIPRMPNNFNRSLSSEQENRSNSSNLSGPHSAGHPGRRKSFYGGTNESRTPAPAPAPAPTSAPSRLKRPSQYRKSIGGRL